MSLRALADAIQTLSMLIKRSREIDGRADLPAGAKEKLDWQIDETMRMALSALDEVVEKQASGELDESVMREDAGIKGDDP